MAKALADEAAGELEGLIALEKPFGPKALVDAVRRQSERKRVG